MCDYMCDYVLFDRARSSFFTFFKDVKSIICNFCVLLEFHNGIIYLQNKPIYQTNQADFPSKSIRFV